MVMTPPMSEKCAWGWGGIMVLSKGGGETGFEGNKSDIREESNKRYFLSIVVIVWRPWLYV